MKVVSQGRHRYHQLASAEVSGLLETITRIDAVSRPPAHRRLHVGPRDAAMRAARTCYDHLAGWLGVAIADGLLDRGAIEFDDGAGMITEFGLALLTEAGISMPERSPTSSRPLCRPCLDWSERRPHVAGRLGAAICMHFFDNGFVKRLRGTRTLTVTPRGRCAIREIFDIREWA